MVPLFGDSYSRNIHRLVSAGDILTSEILWYTDVDSSSTRLLHGKYDIGEYNNDSIGITKRYIIKTVSSWKTGTKE